MRSLWIVCTAFFAMAVTPSALTAETNTMTFEAGDYVLEQTSNGEDAIIMSDPDYVDQPSPGDPALPMKVVNITVPEDYDLSDLTLTIDNMESVILPGTYEIAPMPPQVSEFSTFWGMGKTIEDGKNLGIYEQNAFYPERSVELLGTLTSLECSGPGSSDCTMVKLIRIGFSPFRYNPVDKTLVFASEATVTIGYTGRKFNSAPPLTIASPATTRDYVIITTNATASASRSLDKFVTMKERQGRSVQIVTETDFDGLTGQAPNGRAEKIRKWLQDNRGPLGIENVLLIGNPDPDDWFDSNDTVGDIPMKMCYPYFYSHDDKDAPTDFFYADLVGNWDLDGDQVYGVDLSSTNERSPDPSIAPTTFSARWEGQLKVDVAGFKTVWSLSDDGIRLWLDGNLIIDNWTVHPPTDDIVSLGNLTVGMHDIRIEYFQNTGHAVLAFRWALPRWTSADFYHWDAGSGSYKEGLNVTYFDNIDLTGPSVTKIEKYINHIWSTGDNGPNQRQATAQVKVGRIPVYNNDINALDEILDKIIAYESADPTTISWRNSILVAQNELDPGVPEYELGEYIRNDIAVPNAFASTRIYADDYAGVGGPTPDFEPVSYDLMEEQWINSQNGRGMVTWYAHGSPTYSDDIFESARAVHLVDTKPSFTYQISCNTGYPEYTDNLGYSLLQHGAVATVAASRVSWTWGGPPDRAGSGSNPCLGYRYTKYLIEDGKTAGDALMTTKADTNRVDMNAMVYNLYGDPDSHIFQADYNEPPVVNPGGPYTGDQGSYITLDASGSYDPDEGDTLEFRWDLNNDGTFDTSWSSSPTTDMTDCEAHTINAAVEARDAGGIKAKAVFPVTFVNVNPVVSAGLDRTADEGEYVYFVGNFTDPGCEPFTTAWDFGDSSVQAGTLYPVHAYGDNGAYVTELTVTDGWGAVGMDELTATVNNVAPIVNMDAVTPTTVMVGQPVLFEGSFSDPGWLDTHTADWNFGNGTFAAGTLTEENTAPDATGTTEVTYTFVTPGTYTVTLTITDDDGAVGTAVTTVTVTGFNFNVSPNPVPAGAPVTVAYTIPPAFNGATVRIIEHHEWYIEYRTELNQAPLSGSVGSHMYADIWYWNKWYFGSGSGPYLIELEVNGSVVDSVNLSFAY